MRKRLSAAHLVAQGHVPCEAAHGAAPQLRNMCQLDVTLSRQHSAWTAGNVYTVV